MSSFAVTAERLTVHPHPNADALELAQVGEYRAVVVKGRFATGDYALYIPEQALLPDELVEEFGLAGRLAGKAGNRVKAIRLRGELSQGLVVLARALDGEDLEVASEARTDFAERLGITKWVPEVPTHFGGAVSGEPELLDWIDIENLQRYPNVFTDGEEVEATEKIHGTSYTACWIDDEEGGHLVVTSKGLGAQGLVLNESEENVYWRITRALGIGETLRSLAEALVARRVALYGELYGRGIQDLHYASAGIALRAFDVRVDMMGRVRWLERDELTAALAGTGIETAPVLYRGPFGLERLREISQGHETVSGTQSHLREGIVLRAVPERRSDAVGGRAIAKLVSGDYLVRKGGTEYE